MANRQIKQVILHIGAPKTGTTSLQTFFSRNREQLLSNYGLWYPPYPHDRQAILGKPTTGNGAAIARLLSRPKCPLHEWEQARTEYLEALAPHPRILYSSENFFGLPDDRWQRLREFLGESVSVDVILYARPQIAHMLSAYGQAVRNSGYKAAFSQYVEEKKHLFLFHQRVRMIRSIFGDASVTVKPFLAAALQGSSGLIGDFLSSIGINAAVGLTDVDIKENPSIDYIQLVYGRLINSMVDTRGIVGDIATFAWKLGDSYDRCERPPTSRAMSHEDISFITGFFAADNERLFIEEFAGRWNFNEENARTAQRISTELDDTQRCYSAFEVLLLCHLARLEREVQVLRASSSPAANPHQPVPPGKRSQ